MNTSNREHPEYIARKTMWRQYKDLYAGGERLRLNASDYLVRRQKEPGPVYQERLNRVFTISFPDRMTRERFFANPRYREVRAEHFEPAVARAIVLAELGGET